MPFVRLHQIAQARAGDKGDAVNIGLFAPNETIYRVLVEQVTEERVKAHFHDVVYGEVRRYCLPNIQAINFVCHQALNGGGSNSIRMDNLGKCFGTNLLRMTIEVDETLLRKFPLIQPTFQRRI